MNALLICPSPRPAVALLAKNAPLAIAPLLGKCMIEYWIEYLVRRSVGDIRIRAADRPDQIAAVVGDGARWGVHIVVEPEPEESSPAQAAAIYCAHWKERPEFIVLLDHLPGRPGRRLFDSYATWFNELYEWIPRAQTDDRIGQCEVEPGVWVGLRARVSPSARFIPPCWLGDHVAINREAVIGPGAIIEPGAIVAEGAQITQSIIGAATFVGAQIKIEDSIASRHTLVNWSTNSILRVPDACWLSSLRGPLRAQRPASIHGAMNIQSNGNKLHVSHLGELSAVNATPFIDAIRETLTTAASIIEVDLTGTEFIDSCGLATLCSLHRITSALGIRLRLLHPGPPIQQLLRLTQLYEFFDIDGCFEAPKGNPNSMSLRASPLINPESPHCPA
jgi:anti-anti-sigma factor